MSLSRAQLTGLMESAVRNSRDHVEDGGMPFVGFILDDAGRLSGHGVNEVASTRDPSAHAEIVAMRQVLQERNLGDLEGYSLLATGEPCGLCYRFALQQKIKHVYIAVDAETVATFGIDYRSSYHALRVDRSSLAGFTSSLPVQDGNAPFTRYLELNHL